MVQHEFPSEETYKGNKESGKATFPCESQSAQSCAEESNTFHLYSAFLSALGDSSVNDLLFEPQSTSNTPAAPMPPPMHMVTTTRFAPRRLPSISAWPVRRWPLTP